MSSQLREIMGSTDFKVDRASYTCGSKRNSNYLVFKPYNTSLKLLKIKKIQVYFKVIDCYNSLESLIANINVLYWKERNFKAFWLQ